MLTTSYTKLFFYVTSFNFKLSPDEAREDKHTIATFSIEPIRGVVRLMVMHDRFEPGSEMLRGITDGWPKILPSLKSLLETGRPLPTLW